MRRSARCWCGEREWRGSESRLRDSAWRGWRRRRCCAAPASCRARSAAPPQSTADFTFWSALPARWERCRARYGRSWRRIGRGRSSIVGWLPTWMRCLRRVAEMHGAQAVEGVPVVLLTPGSAKPSSGDDLRRIGPGARQVIAWRSGHWIHLDEPELVLDMIRRWWSRRAGAGWLRAARLFPAGP